MVTFVNSVYVKTGPTVRGVTDTIVTIRSMQWLTSLAKISWSNWRLGCLCVCLYKMSVTSECPPNKAHVRSVRVNDIMTLDGINQSYLVHGGCHVTATLNGCMQASLHGRGWGTYSLVGAHTAT
jgi:hypothetical protein